MQRIDIVGNLVQDAALIQNKEGGSFISMRVACNESNSTDKVYYDVTASYSGVMPYLKQGKRVFISGFPTVVPYMQNNGQPAAIIKISARQLELL